LNKSGVEKRYFALLTVEVVGSIPTPRQNVKIKTMKKIIKKLKTKLKVGRCELCGKFIFNLKEKRFTDDVKDEVGYKVLICEGCKEWEE